MKTRITALIITVSLAAALEACGNPCLQTVAEDVVSQAPAAAEKLAPVVSSPSVPADMKAAAAGVQAALTSSSTPACQMPGWVKWAEEILEIVGPILVQEIPKVI
jgi:hypothetical protein